MSLLHWWPLNGDLIDRCTGESFNNSGWTVNNSGKIGKCYSANNGAILSKTLTIGPSFSFACWVKNNDCATYPKTHLPLKFSNSGVYNTGASYRGWDFSHGTADGNYRFTINDGVLTPLSLYWSKADLLPKKLSGWHHICLSCDYNQKTVDLYVNGMHAGTNSLGNLSENYSGTLPFTLGQIYGWKLDGYVNDFRIYDHALSQAEAKELSKCLVTHYSFNDIFIEPTTNLVKQNECMFSRLTVNLTARYDATKQKHTLTTTNENNNNPSGAIRMNVPLSILTNGKTYYISYKWRPLTEGANLVPTDWVDAPFPSSRYTTRTEEDYKVTEVQCIPNKDYTSTYRFLDFSMTANSQIEIWDIQLQGNSMVTPFTPTSRPSLLVNETGYYQPTDVVNTALSLDSALGLYSLDMPGDSYISGSPQGDASQGATVSMWIKLDNAPDAENWVAFADANSKLGFGFWKSGNTAYGVAAANSSTNKRRVLDALVYWKNTDWNHVVVTVDSSGVNRCWINGVEGSYGDPDYWTHANYFTIGCRYRTDTGFTLPMHGMIDDFRFYNTCLSEDDVLDLYKFRGMISNKNDIIINTLDERFTAAKVTNKSVFESIDFKEEKYNGYDELDYIESNGKQYINTELILTSEDYTIELDMQWTGSSVSAFESFAGFMVPSTTLPRVGLHKYSSVLMYGADATITSSITPTHNRMKYKVRFKNGAQTLFVDDVEIMTSRSGFNHTTNTLPLYIFARNCSSGYNYSYMKLYGAKIYNGDTLIRNYVPVNRQKDNTLGIYDTVTNTFYAGGNSNKFISGAAITNKCASIYRDGRVSARTLNEN
jgi:hypothetical protein